MTRFRIGRGEVDAASVEAKFMRASRPPLVIQAGPVSQPPTSGGSNSVCPMLIIALRAVSSGPNRAKGDSDPASWMPPYRGAWCTYLVEWVEVKIRWRLAVDATERSAIQRAWAQAGCARRASPPIVSVVPAP